VASIDIAAVVLRLVLGWTMFAHGWNHVWGGGKLPGTARWFGSIGFRHSEFQALMASVTELAVGPMLVLGLLTPLACAGAIGVMLVALIANHLKNGFFIFRPGEGYEYVLMVTCVAIALGALGGGRVSLDNAIGFDVDGWGGLALAVLPGAAGAAAVLGTSWRPEKKETKTT
jgi:putative oxidoreductase